MYIERRWLQGQKMFVTKCLRVGGRLRGLRCVLAASGRRGGGAMFVSCVQRLTTTSYIYPANHNQSRTLYPAAANDVNAASEKLCS